MWKLLHNALPTGYGLACRSILMYANCLVCAGHVETPEHLFRECEVARHVWKASVLGINVSFQEQIPLTAWERNFLRLFFFSSCRWHGLYRGYYVHIDPMEFIVASQ